MHCKILNVAVKKNVCVLAQLLVVERHQAITIMPLLQSTLSLLYQAKRHYCGTSSHYLEAERCHT